MTNVVVDQPQGLKHYLCVQDEWQGVSERWVTCRCTAICRCAAGCAAGAATQEHQRLLQLAGAAKFVPRVTCITLASTADTAAGGAGAAVLVLRQPRLQCVGQQNMFRVVKLLIGTQPPLPTDIL